jgi:uncharacterized damage-inducible protein DinB
MVAKDDISRLLRYTVWANHRIMRSAVTLPVEDFKRDLGGSHGGVRGTLAHTMWAELVWLERWKGVPTPPRIDESQFGNVVELRDRWTVIEEHRQAWFEGLADDAAAGIIRYRTTEGVPYENPLWPLVQHLANHSTYHRGQVMRFLRHLGARPVATDMIVWDREEQARAIRDAAPRPG